MEYGAGDGKQGREEGIETQVPFRGPSQIATDFSLFDHTTRLSCCRRARPPPTGCVRGTEARHRGYPREKTAGDHRVVTDREMTLIRLSG
jgi:hypothetical protein